jgi:CRISPR-associated protein Csm2
MNDYKKGDYMHNQRQQSNQSSQARGLDIEIKFYEDEQKKTIHKDLFWDTAEKCADKINTAGNNKANKRTQIRRFYDEVVYYADISANDKTKFESNLPFIRMIYAKATYSLGRGHITEEFRDMLKKCITQTKDVESFYVFKSFFEAFMGFYRNLDK